MNQVFSFQRFTLVVAKHWAENKRRYVLSVLAFIGLLSLWFLFLLFFIQRSFDEDKQIGTYLFSLYLGGAIYASQYFRDLGSRPRAINYLMTPASTAEKVLCSLLYTLVLFFVVCTVAFYLVDFVFVAIANVIHPYYNGSVRFDGEAAKAVVTNVFDVHTNKPSTYENSVSEPVFFIAAFSQTAFLLGSIYFSRYSFIKTVIALFLLFVLMLTLATWYQKQVLPGSFGSNITQYEVRTDSAFKLVQLPPWVGSLIWVLSIFVLIPLLWLTTYFRLKEKEV
jgi:hypothetical protein